MSIRFSAAVAMLALAAPAAAKSPAPVRSVSSPPAAAAPGAAFTVTVKAKGTIRLSLSRDARPSRDDLALGSAKARRGRAKARVHVPARAAGAYRLLACAARRCRAAKGVLRVATTTTPPPTTTPPAGGGSSDAGLPPVPTMALLDATPKPTRVTTTGDDSRAVTHPIGAAGGTVQAAGADGSTFTLVVPAGALADDTPITLTPVTKIDGLPYAAGAAAAVDIGPDGLQLVKAATLTITSPHEIPIAAQGGFSWHDRTKELYRLPMRPTKEVSFDLIHFSGYGYAQMTAAERAIDGSSTPSLALDRYQQAMAEVNAAERQSQLAGNPPSVDWFSKVEQFMVDAYDEQIRPRLVEATTDETIAASALQLALGWERSVQLFGADSDPSSPLGSRSAEISKLWLQIVENAYDKTYAKCMAGEPSYGQRFWAFARMSQLMGLDLPDAYARFEQCERFELHVDGDLSADGYAHFSEHTHVDVPVRLTSTPGDLKLTGSAQPVIDPWTVTGNGICAAHANGVQYGDPFMVAELRLRFNLTTQRGPDGRDIDEVLPPDVEAVMAPGTPQEQTLFDCANTGTYTSGAYPLWSTDWLGLAPGRDQYGWYHITGWDSHSGEIPYLTNRIDNSNPSESMHMTLELDHTPGTG